MKLHLPRGSRAALEASPLLTAAKAKQHHLVTTYFDTPDGLLYRAGVTLRVRDSGDTYIQTVKTWPDGRSVATDRGEWEWRIDQNVPDIRRLAKTRTLATIAMGINDNLEPVFVTDIQRTTRLLHLDGNTSVEVAIDEGNIETSAAREPVSELELELKAGCIGPMYRLAIDLQALAPLWISPESKPARGWHLRTGQMPGIVHAQKPRLRKSVQAAVAFRVILGGALGHLMANIGPTLLGSAEGLHQMRLALRRTRAVLELFERHLDADVVDGFNETLRHFGTIFGAARDWDVFCLETLPAAIADLPAEHLRVLKGLGAVKRRIAHVAVVDAVRGRDFTKMVLSLAGWVEAGARQPSTLGDDRMGKRLKTLAPSMLSRAAKKTKKHGRHARRLSAFRRHALRKSLKKLLYDVESLASLYRMRAVKMYRHRCEVSLEILGIANDAEATQRLVLTLAADSRLNQAKAAQALTRWGKRRGRKALHGLKAALKDFGATPKFWS